MEALKQRDLPDRTEAVEENATARRMALEYRNYVESLRRFYEETPSEAVARLQEPLPEAHLERVRNGPPEGVSWMDLSRLGEDGMAKRWRGIKRTVRAELDVGMVALKAVEGTRSSSPLDRAEFVAVRESLAEEWQPRGGMERQLIDTLAQAYIMQNRWLKMLIDRTMVPFEDEVEMDKRGFVSWRPPRQTQADAIDQATAMYDRWNRIYLRTARALRDLRRYSPSVTIQNAGQVNIGEKQLNIREDIGK